MFEVGSAEHLELCLIEELAIQSFPRAGVAEVQQYMARTRDGEWSIGLMMGRFAEMYPGIHAFLIGYFGTDDFVFPQYKPMTLHGSIKDTPRDARGRFLNIPVELDA